MEVIVANLPTPKKAEFELFFLQLKSGILATLSNYGRIFRIRIPLNPFINAADVEYQLKQMWEKFLKSKNNNDNGLQ